MEPIGQTLLVPVADSSQVAVARRTARAQAIRVGLDERCADDVEIVAVELANNLLQHGSGGTLLINAFVHQQTLELLAVDSGQGTAHLIEYMTDGVSSQSTPGLGLGAIKRLSSSMHAYSWPDQGTLVSTCFHAPDAKPIAPGVVCAAMPGEEICGDRWAICSRNDADLYMVADGLGHGLHASDAARAAVEIFMRAASDNPTALLEQMHGPLRATRGAAISIARVDHATHIITYAGVGNVSGSILGEARSTTMVSHNGTVGHHMRTVRNFEYPFHEGDLLVMHSDGLTTHWKLDGYPGLWYAEPSLIAGVLYRDFSRGRDDATALVARL